MDTDNSVIKAWAGEERVNHGGAGEGTYNTFNNKDKNFLNYNIKII